MSPSAVTILGVRKRNFKLVMRKKTMKTKVLFCLLSGMMMLGMVSCLQDDELSVDMVDNEKVAFRFEASVASDTRTTFSEDFTGLVWTKGDRLSFYTDAGDENVPSSTYEKGDKSFSASLSAGAKWVYALYPYGEAERSSDGSFTIRIPQHQTQSEAEC